MTSRSETGAGRRGRALAAVLVALVLAVLLAACNGTGSGTGSGGTTKSDGGAASGAPTGGGASGSRPNGSKPEGAGIALGQLAKLKVAAPRSMRGYSREKFPHWSDRGKSCTTRELVLKRDGQNVRQSRTCAAVSGRWHSVYNDRDYTSARSVDIDHMVPLANAWRSGADAWTTAKRETFANDLDHPQLIAVDATDNRAKGDQSPDQWLPPNKGYWCVYAQDWVRVKTAWKLTVTAPEKAKLEEILRGCGKG